LRQRLVAVGVQEPALARESSSSSKAAKSMFERSAAGSSSSARSADASSVSGRSADDAALGIAEVSATLARWPEGLK
jgi:hypothetical protein